MVEEQRIPTEQDWLRYDYTNKTCYSNHLKYWRLCRCTDCGKYQLIRKRM